jgi:hypothetical protein
MILHPTTEMQVVGNKSVKHRCRKKTVGEGPQQMERTRTNGLWMPIDYYHESEIDGQWEIIE